MKKMLIVFFVGLGMSLSAEDRVDFSLSFCNEEIEQFEAFGCSSSCSTSHEIGALYNFRGDIFFSNREYQLALQDYQKVISCFENDFVCFPSQYLNGICGSLFCHLLLEDEQKGKVEFNKLVYASALMGEQLETVDWIQGGPVLLKSNRPVFAADHIVKVDLPPTSPQENCELQCAGYAVAAAFACSRVPIPAIQFACAACIFGLEQLCLRCCKGDGFWENCVKPLRRLFHDPTHPENPAPHPYED